MESVIHSGDYYLFVIFLGYISLLTLLSILNAWPGQLRLAPAALAGAGAAGSFGLLLAASDDKTEAPTPHRRQEARKKGQVGRSSDLNSAVVLMVIIIAVYMFRDNSWLSLAQYIHHIFSEEMNSSLNSVQFFNIYKTTFYLGLNIMAPVFIAAILFGLAINFAQVGFKIAPEGIKPKLSNINPLEGLKRIFSKRALFDFLKTLLKILIIGFVVYKLVKNSFPSLLLMLNMSLPSITASLAGILFKICITAVVVFLIIAILDLVYQKWQFKQTIKMSKYEVKKEMIQQEGDPLIKAKLREKQRLMSMRRMMQAVPEATVVITNPTHLAVALKYDDDVMPAPQIIAKGAGYVAETIKEKAQENNIPIMQDKPLARSLYTVTEIGDYVPVELYQAVASVLAVIYSISKNRGTKNETQ